MFAKKIELFLMDGTANGRWACELSNWSGKAYKIPRTLLSESKDRNDLVSTGVYFLLGKSDSPDEKARIYIGEAENLFDRLKQHLGGKDFWNEVVVFFSKDENLNKAKIKYLENRFYEIAIAAGRYEVVNKTTPTQSRVSEADKAELEEFLFNAKMITATLGHRVFDQIIQDEPGTERKEKLYIKAARGADACGQPVTDGFVVFSGSKAAKEVAPAFNKQRSKFFRNRLIEYGVLSDQGDHLFFEKDYVFSSPSAAAGIVMGRSANGLTEWKTSSGQILKALEKD
ncbi:MAG: GIY-YIG nuclease family protein [Mariprofundus sp.]